jgi:hypothetical protein
MGSSTSTAQGESLTAEALLSDKPLKVTNLGDHASLKRCVDDATALVSSSKLYFASVNYGMLKSWHSQSCNFKVQVSPRTY